MDKLKKFFNFHIIFIILMIIMISIMGIRLYTWNNADTFEAESDDGRFDRERLDNLVPYTYDAKQKDPKDMIIACFGNAPFADDKGSKDNLTNIIAEKTGATVYNFAFADSYLSSETYAIPDTSNDLFSLYWLTTIFAVENDVIVNNYLKNFPNTSTEVRATLSLLQNLDFNTVDVITIMYDANDYLDGRGMYNRDDSTNITHFGGALEASIALIQEKFPHIHIIVLSPHYAYALNSDGSFADSTITTFGEGPLASYVQYESDVCYKMFASFIDNFYGSLSELDTDVTLKDNIHLTLEGRKRVADEFMTAYNYYLKFRNKD